MHACMMDMLYWLTSQYDRAQGYYVHVYNICAIQAWVCIIMCPGMCVYMHPCHVYTSVCIAKYLASYMVAKNHAAIDFAMQLVKYRYC